MGDDIILLTLVNVLVTKTEYLFSATYIKKIKKKKKIISAWLDIIYLCVNIWQIHVQTYKYLLQKCIYWHWHFIKVEMNLPLQPFTDSRTPAKDKCIFTPDKFDCSFGKETVQEDAIDMVQIHVYWLLKNIFTQINIDLILSKRIMQYFELKT